MITRNSLLWKVGANALFLIRHSNNKSKLCRSWRHVRCFSLLKQSFLTDLSLDINVKELREKHKKLTLNGNRVNIHEMMSEELETKCSEVINNFGVEETRLLKTIQLEHSILYAEGHAVTAPERMTNKKWMEAMTHSSKDERLNYYLFTEHRASINAMRGAEMEENKAKEEENYGESDKSFIYFKDTHAITRWGDHTLASSMSHGIPLVFDMEFEKLMTPKGLGHTAKQLWFAYVANRAHSHPFHFVFTGCQTKNPLYRTLEMRYSFAYQNFLVSEMNQSYINLFPRSSLVYLSPFAKQVLRTFDPSKVYVLAAYSDPKSGMKHGPAKAQEQGIPCMKLPIDESIKWVQGSKDLLLQSVVKVLLDVKGGVGWTDAFTGALDRKHFRHYDQK